MGSDSSGAASALTFRDRCSIFVPFSSPVQRSPLNVAKRSKMNVRHVSLLQITAFWSTKAGLFNSTTSAWPDVVGVLLASKMMKLKGTRYFP